MSGPRLSRLRVAPEVRVRRRIKVSTKRTRSKVLTWCTCCGKYSHNPATHECGKRQA